MNDKLQKTAIDSSLIMKVWLLLISHFSNGIGRILFIKKFSLGLGLVCISLSGVMAQGLISSNTFDDDTDPNQKGENQVELKQVLSEIEQKFEVNFSYVNSTIEGKYVEVDLKKMESQNFEHSLTRILEILGLTFEKVDNDQYIIFDKQQKKDALPNLPSKEPNFSDEKSKIDQDFQANKVANIINEGFAFKIQNRQGVQVSGTVTSEEGDPLPGVNVVVQGTSEGTVTDVNGNYNIGVDEDATLVFTFVGYQTREIQVDGRSTIDVNMVQDVSQLDEVVVVGYGTQKKGNLTGSVDRVSGDELVNRPQSNLGELMQGASPNLQIDMSGHGGEPGSSPDWQIRGMGTITGDDSPLILVDGVEMNVNNINPNDIESISVLKDASASAVYGARGAFGVVLIETKQGGEEEGLNLNYNNNLSWGSPLRLPHQDDSEVWAKTLNHAAANAGKGNVYSDEQVERIIGYKEGTFEHEYDPDNPISYIWGGRRDGNANYDWPHELLGGISFSQQHNVSLSGGVEGTQYHVSAGHVKEPGLYNYGYDYYQRNNLLANLSSQVTDWLNFNLRTKYAQPKSDYPLGITTAERRWMLRNMLNFAPMTPKYNIDGTIQMPHIRNLQDAGRNKSVNNDFLISLGTEIEPIEGWLTNVTYNYNLQSKRNTRNPKPVDVHLTTIGTVGNIGRPSSGFYEEIGQPTYEMLNVRTSYEKMLGDHYFKSMIGYEQEEEFASTLIGSADGLITTEVPSISTALGETTVTDSKYHWATQGIFGRLNYNFREKYLIEFSGRYNGSSRFSEGNRWGLFPSGSAGYVVSEESFWEPLEPYINRFKLRGSYGSLGNQNVRNYLHLSSVPVYPETDWLINGERVQYAGAPGLSSRHLTWETITTLNLGLDTDFLDHRLTMEFDWYQREATDMFGPSKNLPMVLGTGTPQENNAAMITEGYELILRWQDRISSDLSYDVQFNLGDNTSTITKYVGNEEGLIDTWYEGKTVGEIWGYKSDGLIQSEGENMPDQSEIYDTWGPGDMKYQDLNGDGKISEGSRTLDDHGDLTVIGNTSPRYDFGLSAGFNWKGFDFNMRWQGIGKRDWHPEGGDQPYWGITSSAVSSIILKDSYHLDYWRGEDTEVMHGPNTDAFLPKPYLSNEIYKNRQTQSRFVENAGYLRLKNVRIGYTVPSEFSRRVAVQKARFYISGENLLTFQSMPKVFDPETVIASDPRFGGYSRGDAGMVYPRQRTISVGIDLTF